MKERKITGIVVENGNSPVKTVREYLEGPEPPENLERGQSAHVVRSGITQEYETEVVYDSVKPIWTSDDEEKQDWLVTSQDPNHLGS